MKKGVFGLLCFLLGLVVCATAAFVVLFVRDGGTENTTAAVTAAAVSTETDSETYKEREELISEAQDISACIKNGDYQGLAQYVHPEYGVIFSPSATIDLKTNKCFTASEVAAFGGDKESYVWGVASGTGDPIEMTVQDYFKEYVYDFDYVSAPLIGVNQAVKTGNSLENVSAVFPDAQFVDLTNPGSVKTGESPNWSTLRLVFEEYNGKMLLTAIVHSEYTV